MKSLPTSQDKKQAAQWELARRGNLRWMCTAVQLKVLEMMKRYDIGLGDPFWALLHRGCGKTVLGCIINVEVCLRGPLRYTVHMGPTIKDVLSITNPAYKMVFSKLPPDLRPKWDDQTNAWLFPNGSSILMKSSADHGLDKALRGFTIWNCVCEELAFVPNPAYIFEVINPRRIPVNGGLFIATTPPRSPSHPSGLLIQEALASNNAMRFTVDDNPTLTEREREAIIRQAKGVHTSAYRREYLCELVVDDRYRVFSEPWEVMPPNEDLKRDLMGVLVYRGGGVSVFVAGRRDENDRLVVVEEAVFRKAGLPFVAEHLLEYVKRNPDSVICVVAKQEEVDLLSPKGLPVCRPPDKLVYPADVASLRNMAGSDGLHVFDCCPTTIRHLTNCVWDDTLKHFEPSGLDEYFEAVTAVAILCRYCATSKVPPAIAGRERRRLVGRANRIASQVKI